MGRIDELDPESKQFRHVYYYMYNGFHKTYYGRNTYPLYDGGKDRSGRNHRPLWPKLVAKLKEHDIDITHYLETVMEKHHIDRPQETVLPEYIREYVETLKNYSGIRKSMEIEERFLIDKARMRMHDYKLEFTDAAKRILGDLTIDASPLAKYLFGLKFHAGDSIDRWFKDAYRQYRSKKIAYDRWYSDRIPEDWKTGNIHKPSNT
ncbi:MAG: hypothetical protein IJQ31_12210 [Thermoguttaceae bacterium]|nr:hypothetical protein [Thermoguttaceae bacterium]